MYKKEAAGAVAVLAGIWLNYTIVNKLQFAFIPAFAIYMYWFVRMIMTDYQKD